MTLGDIYDTAEGFFSAVGGKHPLGRLAIVGGATILVLEAFKPSFAYNPDGSRKLYGDGQNYSLGEGLTDDIQIGTTKVPFWVPPLILGGLAATFI